MAFAGQLPLAGDGAEGQLDRYFGRASAFLIDNSETNGLKIIANAAAGAAIRAVHDIVEGLQTSLENGVAAPEAWQPGDKVLG